MGAETQFDISEMKSELSARDRALLEGETNEVSAEDVSTKADTQTIELPQAAEKPEAQEVRNALEQKGAGFLEDIRFKLEASLGDENSQKSWAEALSDKAKLLMIRATVGLGNIVHSDTFNNVADFCKDNLPSTSGEIVILVAMIALPLILKQLKMMA